VRRVTSGTIEAMRRARVALRCVDSLLPEATPRRRRFLASKILSMCWDERAGFMRGMTQWQAQALILPNMQCIAKNCPELVFWEPIARSLNMFFHDEEE
jgi:hypothetical protein